MKDTKSRRRFLLSLRGVAGAVGLADDLLIKLDKASETKAAKAANAKMKKAKKNRRSTIATGVTKTT